MVNKLGLNRLLTQLKTEDWIGRVIDNHQERANPERWKEPDLTIHPSGAGSPCAREIELGLLGYRTAIAPKSLRRMDNGTYAHSRWERDLKDVGILHSCEVNVRSTDPLFNGTCDIIIENPTTGKLHIGEIKTMNANRWRRIPDQQQDRRIMMRHLMTVERPYVYQLTQYCVMIPKVLGLDIDPECFFLFENTDTQEFKIRYGIPDDRLKEEAFANVLEAQKAGMRKELLKPPYQRGSSTCEHCYKKEMCYKLQDGDEEATEDLNAQFAKL